MRFFVGFAEEPKSLPQETIEIGSSKAALRLVMVIVVFVGPENVKVDVEEM